MIENVTVGTMTMAAGKKIYGSPIRWILKNKLSDFKRVIVFDGALDEESKEFYSTLKNVEVVNMPWDDLYVKRYQAFGDKLEDDSWGLWLDDDEFPSDELKSFLKRKDLFPPKSPLNMFHLPCVTYLTEDFKTYAACEDPPGDDPNVWTKHILFKKTDTLDFHYEGSHVIPTHRLSERAAYIPFHYNHMKSLKSFVYNDVWQAFLSPRGQGFSSIEERLFMLNVESFQNTKEFKEATKNGTWSPGLKKIAALWMKDKNRPVSRLGWVYWVLEGHAYEFSKLEPLPKWEDIKKYVLEEKKINLYEKNMLEGTYILNDVV